MTPEQKARVSIDALLTQAGWHVCDMAHANIHAERGVALREFPLNAGYCFADYLPKLNLLRFLRTLKDSMRRINQGAAQPNLNTSIIKSARIPLPSAAEQQRVVAEINRRMSSLSGVETEVDANLKRAGVAVDYSEQSVWWIE